MLFAKDAEQTTPQGRQVKKCTINIFKEIHVLSWLKYHVFMIMARSLLEAYFVILKLEETIAKSNISKKTMNYTDNTCYGYKSQTFYKIRKFNFFS